MFCLLNETAYFAATADKLADKVDHKCEELFVIFMKSVFFTKLAFSGVLRRKTVLRFKDFVEQKNVEIM
jgi:hypothetical protein